MTGIHLARLSRRQFVTKVMPMCALTCVVGSRTLAYAQSGGSAAGEEPQHMFDLDAGRKLTYRQLMGLRYGEFIGLAKALSEELGEDRVIEFLNEYATQKMLAYGKRQAEHSPDDSFATYVEQFRGGYDNLLAMEIVEDTDRVFELKVTECIWATTFLGAGAGKVGHAAVCIGDYAWARGFNPKIEMVRDKTLMQGHDCCNHRYLWKG